MPRVQVVNKLHEGRARASHSLHVSLQTVDKPHCNGRGLAHAHSTMLCIHLVIMVMYSLFLIRCDPVFVKYQFLQQLEHRSTGRPQAADVTWAESRVILLGTLERQLLVEWLRGPPLAVEVHDRDRRMEACQDPAVFGMESRDDLLGTHAFGTGG